jgi:hypothetical protein
MGKKEEITDIIDDIKARYTPENYEALGIKKGKVLKFNYEGTPVNLKITRMAMGRVWAEHVTLTDMDTGMSHYGHLIDATVDPPFCQDCNVQVYGTGHRRGRCQKLPARAGC